MREGETLPFLSEKTSLGVDAYVLFIDSVDCFVQLADGLCGHQDLVDICGGLWCRGTRLFGDNP